MHALIQDMSGEGRVLLLAQQLRVQNDLVNA